MTVKKRLTDCDRIVSDNLKRIRKNKGVKSSECAEHLGVSTQQYMKYESGANRVSAANAFKLARFIGVPVILLAEGTGYGVGE